MKKDKISGAVIRRLPKYYRYLRDLEREGVERISSQELSSKMGIKATQIRQDLNCFGGFGQQGYGYQVKVLKNELKRIIGLDNQYNAIIVGMGNIGQALAHYASFEQEGIHVIGMFDVNPKLVGNMIRNTLIMDIDLIPEYIEENDVDFCIIATPKEKAQDIANTVIEGGVTSIWNFAPIDVEGGPGVSIENVHLNDSLYTLIYRMNSGEDIPSPDHV